MACNHSPALTSIHQGYGGPDGRGYPNHSAAAQRCHCRPGKTIGEAVKEQLRRQGLKPAHIAKREIVAIAEDYLAQHRQAFLEQTAERVRTSPALRALS